MTERNEVARALAKLVGTFHNVSYYAPEMKDLAHVGLPEYWRAYMAYRSAPMGRVPAVVVQATFYNFAGRFCEAAVPSAWETTTPHEVMAVRDRCISQALQRGLPSVDAALLDAASELVLPPILQVDAGARPLFAAHRALPVPTDPLMRLWHSCTLWREYRGDGHNLALAAAHIDGIECHVLLAAKGVGDPGIIGKIRGWTNTEWQQAHQRLEARELITADGRFTDAGRLLREDIEHQTDRLCEPAYQALGSDAGERAIELLGPLVGQLIASGLVPGRWPPRESPSAS